LKIWDIAEIVEQALDIKKDATPPPVDKPEE
jgi:hypothetical protein